MDIQLTNINKHFGSVHANRDISMTLKSGQIVGILGENGAGKSTLMKILSGYQPADSGHIAIDGTPLKFGSPLKALEAGIGMLQQDPLDVASFTVLEDFIYGQPPARRTSGKAATALLRAQAERFGFHLPPDAPVASLSIGQRQQLEIVRLLALGVKALILDEPTTGISAEQKDILFGALRELATRDGMIVLLVSHKLEDVIALCDEVIVLRGGRLVGDRQMPATTHELVTLMFGQQLTTHERPKVALGEPDLKLDNVTLRTRRMHVDHFTLHPRRGEVIGFAGLDGSGQELILRACAGLEHPLSGTVSVRGKPMNGGRYRDFLAEGIVFCAAGRVEEGLIAGMTLTEHIALIGQGATIDWQASQARADAQIKHYNVRGTPQSEIQQLSGGNQQRFLMALLPDQPTVLVLEQPTRGLDVDSARYIWEQLLLRREQGASILFTSPDLDEVVQYSDRIVVCFAGRTTEIADASQVTIDELGRLIGGAF
ncbi:MAG: ATP-binding cassette domain-containing protein [Pleurocapsa minor GSE-CHR-MK-17-07R]|jgi:simple sugar transport system ATP-binding protein|nr:ATP-binding cassette domain-containing protein [Pleurocapsa minor GSE-CHR-MK 17-07R]